MSAFMLMSLDEDGDVTIHSSEHVKTWTESVFHINASEQLRHAHKVTSTDAEPRISPRGESFSHVSTLELIQKRRSRFDLPVDTQQGESIDPYPDNYCRTADPGVDQTVHQTLPST